MFFEPTMLLLIPGMLFAFFAQWKVTSTFKKYAQVRSSGGRTGKDAARALLNAFGAGDVQVEHVPGSLTDHYDPTKRVVRLSDDVYGSDSIAALGVAAHEVGHALQHANGYMPMRWRWSLLGPANIGSMMAMPLAFIGLILGSGGMWLLDLGIILFTGVVLFHVVTLPVELNASSRAYKHLTSAGIATPDEALMAKKVLDAAALTYLAAAAAALLGLLRLVLLRNSRN